MNNQDDFKYLGKEQIKRFALRKFRTKKEIADKKEPEWYIYGNEHEFFCDSYPAKKKYFQTKEEMDKEMDMLRKGFPDIDKILIPTIVISDPEDIESDSQIAGQ